MPIAERIGTELILNRFPDAELRHLLLQDRNRQNTGTLLVHWGFGIGASFAHNGAILDSTRGSFLEIGHWPAVPASKASCACGAHGCVEAVASMWALIPELQPTFPDCPLDEYQFSDFIQTVSVDHIPGIVNSIAVIADVMYRLEIGLFPDRVFVISPFLQNREIEERLKSSLSLKLANVPVTAAGFELLPTRFSGSTAGTSAPLFGRVLSHLLTARW